MTYRQYVDQLTQGDNFILILAIVAFLLAYLASRLQLTYKPRLWHVLILALFLRMPLMAESLWYDETFTGVVANLPDVLRDRVIASDVHPNNAYAAFRIGDGYDASLVSRDVVLRFMPLLFGLAVIVMTYHITKLFYPTQALLASLLVALLPVQIAYSAEARAYMEMVFWVLLAFYWIVKPTTHKDNIKNVSLAFVGIIIPPTLHAHGYIWSGMLLLMLLKIKVWDMRHWNISSYTGEHSDDFIDHIPFISVMWAFFGVVAGFAMLDKLPSILAKAGDVADGFWLRDVTAGGFLSALQSVTVGFRMPSAFMVLVAILVFGVTGLALWQTRKNKLLLVMIFAVPLITLGISLVWGHSVFLPRALLPVGIFVAIGWARCTQESPIARWAVALVVIVPLVLMYHPSHQKMDLRKAITQGCANSDVIFAPSTSAAIVAKWYGGDMPIYIDSAPNDLNQWLSDDALLALGFMTRTTLAGVPASVVCVPFVDNPMIGISQRFLAHDLAVMVANRRATKTVFYESRYTTLSVYEVRNGH